MIKKSLAGLFAIAVVLSPLLATSADAQDYITAEHRMVHRYLHHRYMVHQHVMERHWMHHRYMVHRHIEQRHLMHRMMHHYDEM